MRATFFLGLWAVLVWHVLWGASAYAAQGWQYFWPVVWVGGLSSPLALWAWARWMEKARKRALWDQLLHEAEAELAVLQDDFALAEKAYNAASRTQDMAEAQKEQNRLKPKIQDAKTWIELTRKRQS